MNKKIKRLSVFRKDLALKNSATIAHEQELLISESLYEPSFGKLLKETQYSADGVVEQVLVYDYNSQGFLTGEELLEAVGTVLEKKSYEPDGYGRIAREFIHYSDGSADRIEYKYDEKERIVKKLRFDEDDELEAAEHFDFEGDLLTRECRLDANGELLSDTKYTYDDQGNVIEVISDNPEEEIWYRKVYRYDAAGQHDFVTTFNREGDPVERVSFEYDDQGRPTQIVEENRRQKNTLQMEYNERGDIVFQEEKDLNGEVINRIERIYNHDGFLTESFILVRDFQRGISRHYALRNEYVFFD